MAHSHARGRVPHGDQAFANGWQAPPVSFVPPSLASCARTGSAAHDAASPGINGSYSRYAKHWAMVMADYSPQESYHARVALIDEQVMKARGHM